MRKQKNKRKMKIPTLFIIGINNLNNPINDIHVSRQTGKSVLLTEHIKLIIKFFNLVRQNNYLKRFKGIPSVDITESQKYSVRCISDPKHFIDIPDHFINIYEVDISGGIPTDKKWCIASKTIPLGNGHEIKRRTFIPNDTIINGELDSKYNKTISLPNSPFHTDKESIRIMED